MGTCGSRGGRAGGTCPSIISCDHWPRIRAAKPSESFFRVLLQMERWVSRRSEEHTSELQSPCNLVCRLLLEKKKNKTNDSIYSDDRRFSIHDAHCCVS